MTDPIVLADAGVTVDGVHAGSFVRTVAGTTRMEKFFNQFTIGSASVWLYHHPCDERSLPETLPEPSPVTMGMSGARREFSGEPIFGSVQADGYDEPLAKP